MCFAIRLINVLLIALKYFLIAARFSTLPKYHMADSVLLFYMVCFYFNTLVNTIEIGLYVALAVTGVAAVIVAAVIAVVYIKRVSVHNALKHKWGITTDV